MVNNEMALTFSVRNNPGTYALLLGSGVSIEAGIPTGWGILNDVIQQIAETQGDDPGPEPAGWYRDEYGEEPGYDDILEQLAQSQQERQSLLEDYFEPTKTDREEGLKTPSDAHHSIAWLVNKGYINVIVTTNFDRLLEQALQERGVTPTVISTAAAAAGATPLAHEDAVILKINGDYKETNIKNTSNELDEYDPAIRRLIDQVFDEYGLIVCGWSAKYDTALRNALLECESRRYTTFWAYHGRLEDEASELVEHRDGTTMQIDGAAAFFTELRENVQALGDAEDGAPLTRDVARERVKRYMTREERRIDLADLLQDETERVRNRVFDETRFSLTAEYEADAIEGRLDRYAANIETLVVMCSTCAYFGPDVVNPGTQYVADALQRLGTIPSPNGSHTNGWKTLRHYPGTILLYGTGVAAVASDHWKLVNELLVGTEITVTPDPVRPVIEPIVVALHPMRCDDVIPTNRVRSGTNIIKNRVENSIREPLRDFIADDHEFEMAYLRFEALTDLVLYDRCQEVPTCRPTVPNSSRQPRFLENLFEEFEAQEEEWPPLAAGLFEGSVDRAEGVFQEFL